MNSHLKSRDDHLFPEFSEILHGKNRQNPASGVFLEENAASNFQAFRYLK
jgi:hypothetical protein